jgi:sec-independent protein translocase protein TatA
MGALSIWHILLLGAVLLLLFGGRGKISELMGDVAKGVKSFRKGLNEPDEPMTTISGPQTSQTPTPNKDQVNAGH